LASHVITLFRADPEWTRTHLLPLFDWKSSRLEARSAWEGFLWSPRLFRPFLVAIKEPLLETAKHYDELGKHNSQYATFLTSVALDSSDIFTTAELAEATNSLPLNGLESTAFALVRTLQGAKNQRVEYWQNRILPYLRRIWPKSRQKITSKISERMAQLCIAANESFPSVLQEVHYWLQSLQHPELLIHRLNETELCKKFPEEVLKFLNTIFGDDSQLYSIELEKCLKEIEASNERLKKDHRFIRLSDLLKKHGIT
jgi:hypothetical protein